MEEVTLDLLCDEIPHVVPPTGNIQVNLWPRSDSVSLTSPPQGNLGQR